MTNVIRMAYIDSELAKRRQGQDKALSSVNGCGPDGLAGPGMADLGIQRQPAALGKLHEIDLGPDATLRNIARTEAAKRRLEGGEEEIEEGTGKVRLRRDGKPWRGRRRRNSEDVKRDQLVEQVLRETRCECYPLLPNLSLADTFHSGDIRRTRSRCSQRRPGGRRPHCGAVPPGVHGRDLLAPTAEGSFFDG